ncbi:DNA mismatch repair protein MutS [Candidatus Ichthyocystis hellenicum]|uniref:DNA mismatch repair protein MutS n=1 Tax=Candidatus Ichthyocystis hellenicum TaxID=1561003 RepID=UPI000A7E80B2|nr:DNA mismatch repair protein MutS [Candidatus Ichthyocystis hellenicum]
MTATTDSAVLSPAMQHYMDLKKNYPDAFLMYRIGDFYEFFFEDAVQCSAILGITLTSRSRIPMAGIPSHQLEQYLAKLVRAGNKVAICDQVGQRKIKGKTITDREITQVVTPGTITDNQILEAKSNCCLLAIHKKNDNIGLAWLALTQGVIHVLEIKSENIFDYLNTIRPAEIILSEYADIAIDPTQYVITRVDDWSFDAEHGYDRLCQHFSLPSLDCFDISRRDISTGSAYSLLCYMMKTQKKIGQHVNTIVRETTDRYIILDEKTRMHLEITHSLNRKNDHTIFWLFDNCATSSGSRWIKNALQHPVRDQSVASSRHDAIDWLLKTNSAQQKNYETIQYLLKNTADIERITARLALKTVRPKEIASLRQTVRELPKIFGHIRNSESIPHIIEEMLPHFLLSEDFIHILENTIAEEPSVFVRDGGVIRSGYDEELDHYRSLHRDAQVYIQKLRDLERERTQIPSLKIEYNRLYGYYIEVTPSHLNKIPPDYQRKQSLKNAERFTTEELINLERETALAQTKSLEKEREIFDNFLDHCQSFIKELQICAQSLSLLDGLCSFAYVAHHHKYTRPNFCSSTHLEAVEARHPIIEQHIDQFIPNDIDLSSERQFLLITGPNMGGKSTYMRQTALLVLLSYCGSFVPAKSAKIGTIDRIMTRIGASDNLSSGQSTFMVEMSEMARILRQATPNSLLLIDEIGRGTSTYDGLSLAQAIMKHLIEINKSLCLFATHYFELTHAIADYQRAFNVHLCVEETSDKVVFLHTVQDGVSQKSYGIHVASLAGIPYKTVCYAQKLLKDREEKYSVVRNDNNPEKQNAMSTNDDVSCKLHSDVVDKIIELSIDDLTPREALELLATWKNNISKSLP